MAAGSAIGNVQTIFLESYDALGTKYETNISKGFVINKAATYEEVNTAARALNAITTNTYEDAILATNISVNDEIGGISPTITPSNINESLQDITIAGNVKKAYEATINVTDGVVESAYVTGLAEIPSDTITAYSPTITSNSVKILFMLQGNMTGNSISGDIKIIISGNTYTVPYVISK